MGQSPGSRPGRLYALVQGRGDAFRADGWSEAIPSIAIHGSMGFAKGSTHPTSCNGARPAPQRGPPPSKAERRAEAKAKGYEGEMCGECGHFSLVQNGTCMKCDT
jgi:hypothetical protein